MTLPRELPPAGSPPARTLWAGLVLAALLTIAGCGGGGGDAARPSGLVQFLIPRLPSQAIPLGTLHVTIQSVNGTTTLPTGVPPTITVPLSAATGGNTALTLTGETVTVPQPTITGTLTGGTVVALATLVGAAGEVLATNTATLTVQSGAANQNFAVTLPCVVTSVSIVSPMLGLGTSFSGPLTVTEMDATGALLVGPTRFAQPITLTEHDSSGHTQLFVTGQAPGQSVTVATADDVVLLNYDGSPFAAFPITAQGGGIPAGTGGDPANPGGNAGQVAAPK